MCSHLSVLSSLHTVPNPWIRRQELQLRFHSIIQECERRIHGSHLQRILNWAALSCAASLATLLLSYIDNRVDEQRVDLIVYKKLERDDVLVSGRVF